MAPQGRQEPVDQPRPSELLHRPQQFEEADSFEARDALIDYLVRDLLGPWDGPDEELRRDQPRAHYLAGQPGSQPRKDVSAS